MVSGGKGNAAQIFGFIANSKTVTQRDYRCNSFHRMHWPATQRSARQTREIYDENLFQMVSIVQNVGRIYCAPQSIFMIFRKKQQPIPENQRTESSKTFRFHAIFDFKDMFIHDKNRFNGFKKPTRSHQ